MTDIGEAIAIAAVQQNPNEPCWYCEEPPVSDKKNEETADPDTSDSESEDAVPENDDDNDSSELGSSLGSNQVGQSNVRTLAQRPRYWQLRITAFLETHR